MFVTFFFPSQARHHDADREEAEESRRLHLTLATRSTGIAGGLSRQTQHEVGGPAGRLLLALPYFFLFRDRENLALRFAWQSGRGALTCLA